MDTLLPPRPGWRECFACVECSFLTGFVAFTFRSSSANYFKREVEDLKEQSSHFVETSHGQLTAKVQKQTESFDPLSFCPHSVCGQM